jgi:hypothetical protein
MYTITGEPLETASIRRGPLRHARHSIQKVAKRAAFRRTIAPICQPRCSRARQSLSQMLSHRERLTELCSHAPYTKLKSAASARQRAPAQVSGCRRVRRFVTHKLCQLGSRGANHQAAAAREHRSSSGRQPMRRFWRLYSCKPRAGSPPDRNRAVASGPVRHAARRVGKLHAQVLTAQGFAQPRRLARVGGSDATRRGHVSHNGRRLWIGDYVEQLRWSAPVNCVPWTINSAPPLIARHASPPGLPWSNYPPLIMIGDMRHWSRPWQAG